MEWENGGSIINRYERMDIRAIGSGKISDIDSADALIIPGIGFFTAGMQNLKKFNLLNTIKQTKEARIRYLLGNATILTRWNEEGNIEGLGLLIRE